MTGLSETEGLWDGACIDVCQATAIPQGECICGYHDNEWEFVSRDMTVPEREAVEELFGLRVRKASPELKQQLIYENVYG